MPKDFDWPYIQNPDLYQTGGPRRRTRREERQGEIAREYEQLCEEERRTPHGDSLAFWMIADELSGEKAKRKRRKRELERDYALAACGYEILWVPLQDPRHYALLTFGHKRITCTLTYHYLEAVEDTPPAYWLLRLDQQAMAEVRSEEPVWYQHHLCCASCEEPVLHCRNQTRALEYLKWSIPSFRHYPDGKFETQYDLDYTQLVEHEYRWVEDGSLGPLLSNCPTCGHPLTPETTKEIELHIK